MFTIGRIYFWRVATITRNVNLPNALTSPRMFQVTQ
jgi:hypothetical protein